MSLPPFELPVLGGRTLRFPTGRTALLIFWWSECPTCRLSLPIIAAACRAFGGSADVAVIAQDPPADRPVLEAAGAACPVLDDAALETAWRFGVDAVPAVILAGPSGEELQRFVGFARADWEALFDRLRARTGCEPPAIDWSGFPAWRPGCGPRNFLPAEYERLQAALGPFQPPPGGNTR
ncbi:MAG: TlpA disulfide reductase family protein [Tepidiforma sp.]